MPLKFVDVGGAFEAAFVRGLVVLRQKGTQGPNFNFGRDLIEKLLALFPDRSRKGVP